MFCASYALAQPAAAVAGPAPAAGVEAGAGFARLVSEFTLGNGLHFVLVERHEAPVVSFHAYIRAGAANVPTGQSGLAQLLERLTWSGTESIGTADWASEKKALDAVEETYDRLEAERNKGNQADQMKLSSLAFDVQMSMERARGFSKPNEYRQALVDNGATGLAANISADAIQYECTLPSNRAELWFSMESQRLARPVLRGFYQEREALAQQVRSPRGESPQARLLENFAAAAFQAHSYRNAINGWPGDVENLRTQHLRNFMERYFVAGNLTIAIAGDITPAEARRLADRYFGSASWAAKPVPASVPTEEPAQTAPRIATAYLAVPAQVAIGYRRPNQLDRDDTVFDVIQAILSGPKGWLARQLIEEKGAASSVSSQPAYPGARYPNVFLIMAAPAPGRTLEQTEAAVQAVLDRLRSQPVDEATLARAKAHVRDLILEALSKNGSTAAVLAAGAAEYGDWRATLTELGQIDKLTTGDVQRVAAKYFVPEHRTAAYLGPALPAAGGGK